MEHKALIIRPGALGDTLMLLPALKDIGKRGQVMVAGREPGLFFLRKAGFQCVNMEVGGWHKIFRERPDPRQRLPVPPQDRVVAYLSDSDGRIGKNLKAYCPGAAIHVLPAYPAQEDKVHVARYLCITLAEAGLPVDPEAAMEQAENGPLLGVDSRGVPGDRIIIHPGSGSPRKNLPPRFWLEFLERISEEPALEGPGKGLVLLGPAEEGLRDFFGKQGPGTLEMVFCPRDEELVSLLGTAHLYAGHDSGITHLAAMFGTPTLALFRQDSLSMWRPLGPVTRIVQSLKPDGVCLEKMVRAARSLIRRRP
jgi:heptosyltransferase-3